MKKFIQWIAVLAMIIVWVAINRQDTVGALRDGSHTVAVLARADREITPKSAAGRYYHKLVWKHNAEMGDILLHKHPEHRMQFVMMIDLFVPAIEALLDGDGDSITISTAQIERLQTELNWLKSVGSETLRADIKREEVRFPPQQFAGMTIAEVYETVITQWQMTNDE